MVAVQDPRQVKLEYLGFSAPASVCSVQQTSAGTGSFMEYETLSVRGAYDPVRPRGFEFVGLGSKDVIHCRGNCDGDMRVTRCGRATILVDSLIAAPIIIEGKEPVRDGFLGFNAYMGLNAGDPMIHVQDNQNLVIGNAYLEVTPGTHVLLEGNADDPAGYVTIMS